MNTETIKMLVEIFNIEFVEVDIPSKIQEEEEQ